MQLHYSLETAAQIPPWSAARRRPPPSKPSSPSPAAAAAWTASALPDDVLLHILRKLGTTANAGRTSVLSRRWRHLWALLPDLYFFLHANTDGVRGALAALESPALAAHGAPALHNLVVDVVDASPDSLAAWLPIAARRLAGALAFFTAVPGNGATKDEDEAPERGAFEMPCFEKATRIMLDLGFLGLAVPPSGVFARLTDLCLYHVQLHCLRRLSEAVSWPRCPSLQKLTVSNARGLGNFTIHSESLLEIELNRLHGMEQLNVVAPALEKLIVFFCFAIDPNASEPVANISAPQLQSLEWRDSYDPSSVQFGEMAHLEWLGTTIFLVYGPDGYAHNRHCVRLLHHFEAIHTLNLTLAYMPDISDHDYLMEDMIRLPDITCLTLLLIANRHSFGASSFHVLRMCTGLRKLKLIFGTPTDSEEQTVCASGCICDQPPNWQTEELVLNRLQEVEISGLRGTEHDFALVKRLLNWATVLKTMTVNFHHSVTESMAKEFCQMILGSSRPEICMKFYVYHFWRKVLYVPEDFRH